MYDAALFVHLLGVAVLMLLVGIELPALLRAPTAPDVPALRAALLNAPLVSRLIPVPILLIVVPGLYMVGDRWSWSQGWVVTTFVVVGSLLVIGPAVNGRRLDTLHAAAEAAGSGPVPAEVETLRRDRVMHLGICYATLETVVLLFLMTNKPSGLVAVPLAVVAALLAVPVSGLTAKRQAALTIVLPEQTAPAAQATRQGARQRTAR